MGIVYLLKISITWVSNIQFPESGNGMEINKGLYFFLKTSQGAVLASSVVIRGG